MRGFTQELLVPLVLGAVLLVQFLYTRLRKPAALTKTETEMEAETEVQTARLPSTAARPRAHVEAADARQAVESPAVAAQTTPARVLPRTWPRLHRFSRTALMPDQHAVQDAIVIAAILRPCHAHRPHDVD